MSLNITKQDRKAAKSTCTVLAVLLVFFVCLSVVFGVLIPRAKDVKALGANQEILSIVEGKDGGDYFLATATDLYRYDALTGAQLSVFPLTSIADMLKREGKYDTLVNGSLNQWSVHCFPQTDGAAYIAYDSSGNIFRLTDDGVNLLLTDDYYLASEKTVIKGCDSLNGDLYLFAQRNNISYVEKRSVFDLAKGATQTKLVWDLDLSDSKVGYTKLTPMPATTGILAFQAAEDGVYIFRTGGSVVRMGLEMVDTVIDGEAVNFYDRAESYYGGTQYQTEYDAAYRAFFLKKLQAKLNTVSDEVKAEYPDEKLNVATYIDMELLQGNRRHDYRQYERAGGRGSDGTGRRGVFQRQPLV